MSQKEIDDLAMELGGWKRIRHIKYRRRTPGYPKAPSSRSAVVHWVKCYKQKQRERHQYQLRTTFWPAVEKHRRERLFEKGEIIHALMKKGWSTGAIGKFLGRPARGVEQILKEYLELCGQPKEG